jgi:uncharacterized protein YbjT (DUF2867 family)
MKMLVAGASGLVGREVVRLLVEAGHEVRTVSREPKRAEALRKLTPDVRILDATVEGALRGVCDGVDVVVSALGAPVTPNALGRASYADVDLKANLALLDEAKRAGVRRFVYTGVYTTPDYAETAYVRAHSEVEARIRASGLSYGVVRPTGVFGALAALLPMANKGPIPLIGDGLARTNPVHERDVAEALVRAAEARGPLELELGGPEVLTRKRIAELAFAACGKPARFVRLPGWLMSAIAFAYGVFNRRMGELLRFVILASTRSCVAPTAGTRALGPYFEQAVKESAASG